MQVTILVLVVLIELQCDVAQKLRSGDATILVGVDFGILVSCQGLRRFSFAQASVTVDIDLVKSLLHEGAILRLADLSILVRVQMIEMALGHRGILRQRCTRGGQSDRNGRQNNLLHDGNPFLLAGKTIADETAAANADRRADETAGSTANGSAEKPAYDGTTDRARHATKFGVTRPDFRIGVGTLARRHQDGHGNNRNDFTFEHFNHSRCIRTPPATFATCIGTEMKIL
jgi:hypothetical protein